MPSQIVIFSADPLRSGITCEVLKRIGLESLQADSILEVKDAISGARPAVAILDTKGVFPNELDLLKNLCRTLRDTSVFLLGNPSLVNTFRAEGAHERYCLHDPFDPELIASKVKEIFCSTKKEKRLHLDNLEHDLKQFLQLD
ncbi:MAG: hypothetical protein JRF37_03720 [Deltaproteobacteria bacterium]|nr:hypothetical protein [Deltaproteobacteria bacterium]